MKNQISLNPTKKRDKEIKENEYPQYWKRLPLKFSNHLKISAPYPILIQQTTYWNFFYFCYECPTSQKWNSITPKRKQIILNKESWQTYKQNHQENKTNNSPNRASIKLRVSMCREWTQIPWLQLQALLNFPLISRQRTQGLSTCPEIKCKKNKQRSWEIWKVKVVSEYKNPRILKVEQVEGRWRVEISGVVDQSQRYRRRFRGLYYSSTQVRLCNLNLQRYATGHCPAAHVSLLFIHFMSSLIFLSSVF